MYDLIDIITRHYNMQYISDWYISVGIIGHPDIIKNISLDESKYLSKQVSTDNKTGISFTRILLADSFITVRLYESDALKNNEILISYNPAVRFADLIMLEINDNNEIVEKNIESEEFLRCQK